MAEKENRRRKVRQNWDPHWLVRVLNRIFKIGLAALKIAGAALATVLLIVIVCGFVVVSILGDYLLDDVLPKAETNLEDYDLEKTSYIYYKDADGNIQILQQLNTTTDRQWVDFEDIPEDLIHAAVAIEDKRFYEHQGVDWITTVKACVNMFFGGSSDFGGSTLTQQLIKNLKLTQDSTADDHTVQRKVLEIFRAIAFERNYDKDVVIEWYMNMVYFGEGCYGVKSAAENYFGKELQDMNTAEMAALIGITNNPSMFNPYYTSVYKYAGEERDGAGRNRYRQQVVLTQMYEQGWLTEEEYLDAYAYELEYKRGIDEADRWNECQDVFDEDGNLLVDGCGYEGPVRDLVAEETDSGTVYYCPDCGQKINIITDASLNVYSWYVDTVLEDVAKALAAQDGVTEWNKDIRANYVSLICRSGYHIYTPYDASVQAAVDAVYTDLEQIPDVKSGQQLQSAIVVIDNRTGDIVAMSGGVGDKDVSDGYNRATDATLQVGSSLKPLTVYAPAFETGLITPATVIDDLPLMYTNGSPYPKNDSRTYAYHRTIYQGIVSSLNAVACQTLDKLGLQYSFNFAKNNFGLSTLTDYYKVGNTTLTDVGIAALGMGALTRGATVRDVTNAYSTFTNGGTYREGRTFLVVLDDAGNVVVENQQESRTILSEKTVDYVNYCLDSAVASGTGTVADMFKELGMDVAGKTGTTGNSKDRYFAGYTGYYTAAVWCGFDTPEEIILVGNTQNPAARLWKAVMLQIHEGKESIPLFDSSKMVSVEICLDSGKLSTEACKNDIRITDTGLVRTVSVLVYPEDAPTEVCDCHVNLDYCSTGKGVANEYCHHFANVGAVKLTQTALVKTRQETLAEFQKLYGKGLTAYYCRSDYIYLVDAQGNDAEYHGFFDNINTGLNVPYKVCTVHTAESWAKYKAEHPWIDGGSSDAGNDTDNGSGETAPDEGGSGFMEDLWDSIFGE